MLVIYYIDKKTSSNLKIIDLFKNFINIIIRHKTS